MPEYEKWKEETPNQDKWKHKYFKVRTVQLIFDQE